MIRNDASKDTEAERNVEVRFTRLRGKEGERSDDKFAIGLSTADLRLLQVAHGDDTHAPGYVLRISDNGLARLSRPKAGSGCNSFALKATNGIHYITFAETSKRLKAAVVELDAIPVMHSAELAGKIDDRGLTFRIPTFHQAAEQRYIEVVKDPTPAEAAPDYNTNPQFMFAGLIGLGIAIGFLAHWLL